jgi:hypothetical protein
MHDLNLKTKIEFNKGGDDGMKKEEFLRQIHEYQSTHRAGYPVTMEDIDEMIAENEFTSTTQSRTIKLSDKQIEAILSKSYSAYFGKSFRNTQDKICLYIMDDELVWQEDVSTGITSPQGSSILIIKGNDHITRVNVNTKFIKRDKKVENPFDYKARRYGRLDEIIEFAEECDNVKKYLLENLHIDFASKISNIRFKNEFIKYYNDIRFKNEFIKYYNDNRMGDTMLSMEYSDNITNKENKTMTTINAKVTKDVASSVLDANKQAALAVAEITIGKAALKSAGKLVKPKLPMFVRGYADTPLFDVIIANLVHIAVDARFKDNVKARKISKAMMTAAALTVSEHFDVDGMIEDFIDSIGMPKGVRLEDIQE